MKKIILSEVSRIHEIMGLKKSLIMEGSTPLKTFLGKIGISFDDMMFQLEAVEGKLDKAYGKNSLEKIKGLFEKNILSIEEREFIAGMMVMGFPNITRKFVNNLEEVLLKNNSAELNGIFKLFRNKNITSSEIADHVLDRRLGIKMSPESVEMWRKYREINTPVINFNRPPSTQTTNVSSVTQPKPTVSTPPTKPTGSAPMGRIQEPHEFTIEGTNRGYVSKGNEKNAIGDQRGQLKGSYSNPTYTKESIINNKKVFSLIDVSQVDYVGRPGYASVSIALPLETKLTIKDVLPELQNRLKIEQQPGGSMYNDNMRNR